MPVFNVFIKILRKHGSVTLLYLSIYVLLVVFFVMADENGGSAADMFQDKALALHITDEDQSSVSLALTDYLASIHDVSTQTVERGEILDGLYYRTLNYVLTIPDGFEASLLAHDAEGLLTFAALPGTSSELYVNRQISLYLDTLRRFLDCGYSLSESLERTGDALASLPDAETVSFCSANALSGGLLEPFFRYQPYILISVLICGLTPVLITLNGTRIRTRTACSPFPAGRHTLALLGGSLFYGLGLFLICMLLCFLFSPEGIRQPVVWQALLNSFVFLLFSAVLAVLVSLLITDSNVLNMVANSIGLVMSFLCGVFVPQSLLPDAVLRAGRFLPAYWYIHATDLLAGRGDEVYDAGSYWTCIGIQLLFAAALSVVTFAASCRRRKGS